MHTEYSGRDNLDVMRDAVHYNRYLCDLVLSLASTGDAVVDFGAGGGTFAEPVRKAGFRLLCIETDPTLACALRASGMTVLDDLAPVPDKSIDYIYSLNVLEHIQDDEAIIRLWFRKLRPNGRLLVYVPAFSVLFSSMDRKVGHHRRYNMRELESKLSRNGFRVVKAEYADSLGFFAALVYKWRDSGDGRIDARALKLYDRWAFPMSRIMDRFTRGFLGKNVYALAVRPD